MFSNYKELDSLKKDLETAQNMTDELEREKNRLADEVRKITHEKLDLQYKLDRANVLHDSTPVKKLYDFQGEELVRMHLVNGEALDVLIKANELNEFLNAVLKSKVGSYALLRGFTAYSLETNEKYSVMLFSNDIVGINFQNEREMDVE